MFLVPPLNMFTCQSPSKTEFQLHLGVGSKQRKSDKVWCRSNWRKIALLVLELKLCWGQRLQLVTLGDYNFPSIHPKLVMFFSLRNVVPRIYYRIFYFVVRTLNSTKWPTLKQFHSSTKGLNWGCCYSLFHLESLFLGIESVIQFFQL